MLLALGGDGGSFVVFVVLVFVLVLMVKLCWKRC